MSDKKAKKTEWKVMDFGGVPTSGGVASHGETVKLTADEAAEINMITPGALAPADSKED